MRLTHLVALPLALLCALPFACGGTAVVERGGTGGAGGAGSTTSTGTSPDAVSTSSTGNDPHAQNCGALCDALSSAGCGDPGCVDACIGGALGACGSAYAAFVACLVQNPVSDPCSTISPACEDARYELESCENPGCPPTECGGGSNGDCFCNGVCFDTPYSIQCVPNDDMTWTCSCISAGRVIATCEEIAGCPNEMYPGCCGSFLGFPQ